MCLRSERSHIWIDLDRCWRRTGRLQIAVTLSALFARDIQHVVITAFVIVMATGAMLVNRSELRVHFSTEVMFDAMTFLARVFESIERLTGGKKHRVSRDRCEIKMTLLAIVLK